MIQPVFFPYQATLIGTVRAHQIVLVEKSRCTGSSWPASLIADLKAVTSKSDGGSDVLNIGYNVKMVRKWIDYCTDHTKAMQQAISHACQRASVATQTKKKPILSSSLLPACLAWDAGARLH
ncbi:hypothetical protein [Saccharibacter floricola]|uniref:hypothetical protein n=1 Tax=Saccharibacter floricola TaxID=231053 RepID=UPI000476B7FF|nr:hypothetical protein [Saccharibacter floricola]